MLTRLQGPDKWTNGFATYISKQEATSSGLAAIENGKVILRVDSSTQLDPSGEGRKSVRLESKDEYDEGLLIADFDHLPGNICGMWPAFWLLHDDSDGTAHYSEIDLIEGISLNRANEITMFTSSQPCTMDPQEQSGRLMRPNCQPPTSKADRKNFESSCGVYAPDRTFGDDFNNKGGGVWALLREEGGVKAWYFERSAVPGDIGGGKPQPENWGIPVMHLGKGNCDVRVAWRKLKIVINTTFCGAYAGEGWGSWTGCREKTGHETCQEFVARNPEAFMDVYFSINSVKLFQMG